jgi:hypothetical protein
MDLMPTMATVAVAALWSTLPALVLGGNGWRAWMQ